MEMRIEKQSLLLNGRQYTVDNLELLRSEIGEKTDSPLLDVYEFLRCWYDGSPYLTVHTSGSTGVPKELNVSKDRMMQSARLTCEYLNLQPGDSALLCMNLGYIGAMMVVVRSLVAGLNLIVRPASGHPLADVEEHIKFAAMVPLQVYNTLHTPKEKERLKQIEILIIGGGAIDVALEAEIRKLTGAIYSTYGMTETLSHIALRRLNGASASEHYHPFSSVKLSLSSENTLVIDAPLICDEILQTNDIARIYPDGSFMILGRKDNVINSGGIKIQAEEIEKILRPLIPGSFVITSIPDVRLGQAVTLLIEGDFDLKEIKDKLNKVLKSYYRPKYIKSVERIPQTENGKIDRNGCRALAKRSELHIRNKHNGQYDFSLLTENYPLLKKFVQLNPYGTQTIDFFNPQAVKALNKALLISYYGIGYWDIPKNYLCPPIPGRADYIHYIADLINPEGVGKERKDYIRNSEIRCLDIGVGANCIYPIIGHIEYGWMFVGSDIDPVSIENARKIVTSNPVLAHKIDLRLQKDSRKIFDGIIASDDYFDVTICNPPFHRSKEEAEEGTLRKLSSLKGEKIKKAKLNFGGNANELWCEGGELRFLLNMISESQKYRKNCGWFTSLVSKEKNLDKLYAKLKSVNASEYKIIKMHQGTKSSRILAWRFS